MTTIRVRVGRDVQAMPLEEYLRGVVPREMPALWSHEALKAQAVVARSYAAVAMARPRHPGDGAHVCDGPCCQVWTRATHPRTDAAVRETAGLVLWYGNRVAQTFYSARCGGLTGAVDEKTGLWEPVWNPPAAPWCIVVWCPCPTIADKDGNRTKRRGHGFGLCQVGAEAYARDGWSFEPILEWYFTRVRIGRLAG